MPKLLVTLPNAREITHDLVGTDILIGRTSDNAIQIDETSISLHHARLTLEKRGYRLKDLDSTNRTWINGVPIVEAELTERCLVRFGQVECIFLPESAAEAEAHRRQELEEIERLKTECAALKVSRDDLLHEVASMTLKLEVAEIGKRAIEEKHFATEEEVKTLKGQLEVVALERESERTRLDGLQREVAEMGAQLDQSLNDLQTEKMASEEKQRVTTEEVNTLRGQLDAAMTERESERTQFDVLQRQSADMRAQIEQALKELHAERDRNAELAGKLDQHKVYEELAIAAKAAHEEIKVRYSKAVKAREGLEIDLADLKLRYAELGAELEEQRARAASVVREQASHQAAVRELVEARAAREAMAAELAAERAQKSQVHTQFRELGEKNNVLDKATHDLKTRLHAAEAQRDHLRIANEQLSESISAAQGDMQMLTNRWSELMGRLPRRTEAEHTIEKAKPQPPRIEPANHTEPTHTNGHEAASVREAEVLQIRTSQTLVEPEGLAVGLRAMSAATERLRQNPRDLTTLHELFGFSRELAQHADARGEYAAVRSMASTLESLLGDLCKVPEQFDGAKLRTLSRAVETLRILIERDHFSAARDSFRAKMCVVSDDDEEPMIAATRLVDLDLSIFNYPTAKLDALAEQECELIVLDPGHREQGWLEYSTRVRAFPRHRRTPVIIITSPEELQDRAVPASFTGSEDFIVRPFNTFEMAVKILTAIFRRRLDRVTALI